MKQLALFFLVLTGFAHAALPDADLGASDRARFHRLCGKLIAPCCWTQSVEIHSSPAADQARVEVVALIRAGKSDREILDSFIRRYGARILAEPEGVKSVVLTTVPMVMSICSGVFLGWFLWRSRRHAAASLPHGAAELFPDSDWE